MDINLRRVMRVGIIAPTKLLNEYCTTDTQYCLPKLLVQDQDYLEFYKERKRLGNYIIMDIKKLGWKREPEDFGVVWQALNRLEPSIVILPSFMFNLQKTLGVIQEFLREFNPSSYAPCFEVSTPESFYEFILESKGQETYALPSHLYRYYKNLKLERQIIHIDNHININELEGKEGILVTSLPIRLGLQGRLITDYLPSPPSLTFEEYKDPFPKIVKRNIEETLRFYGN
jgi:hypothetical protein